MSTTTAPSSQRSRRRPRRPARVLINTEPVVASHNSGSTTARDRTRNGNPIQVSFCFKRPPQPSTLFLDCPDLNRSVAPKILYSVDDLLLLRVNMGSGRFALYDKDFDYFVYRAGDGHYTRPSLQRLRRPHPYFFKFAVGLLPRSDGHYTVAALDLTGILHQYQLHLFHSDTSTWISRMLSLEAPQEFPVKIPGNCGRLRRHDTTTVITIGCQGGTMGFVDLWRGILLCNMLNLKPSLRELPLPLPLVEMSYNDGWGMDLGNPAQRRGIAFIRDKGCLNFVHLEITKKVFPETDHETGSSLVRVDDWALTTWSNKKWMSSSSHEFWHKESVVRASNITIDPVILSVLKDTGLFCQREQRRNLHNLSIYQPSPCINGEDVVYLVARQKFSHPKAWILVVDMKNKGRLQSAAYFGIRTYDGLEVIYCPSRISKYFNQANHGNPASAPGLYADEVKEKMVDGGNTMLKIAKDALAAQTNRQVNRLLLQGGAAHEEEVDLTQDGGLLSAGNVGLFDVKLFLVVEVFLVL